MRTLRELAGWSLLLAVVFTPVAALIALAAMLDDGAGAPCGFYMFALLLVLASPRMWLSARRLRDPRPEDVAQADGRRPVLLLHRFARVSVSVWARMLFPSPELVRDVMEALLERKLERVFSSVGPLLPITRPPRAWLDDPAVPRIDPVWEGELERALDRCALAAIVLDGSEANVHEIERAFTRIGARTILVLPPRIDDAFKARYATMRERIPLLPDLDDPYARFIRFDASARAHLERSLVIAPEEQVAAPKAPVTSWLLTLLPLGAAFFSMIAAPLTLDAYGVDLDGEAIAVWSLGVLAMGVLLAVLSRRAVRLVPINDAVLVTVAASPWMALELITWLSKDEANQWDLQGRLTHTATGAAYAAPLLAAVALMLGGASAIRAAEGRQARFALIGALSVAPFVLLALALGGVRQSLAPIQWAESGGSSGMPGLLVAALIVNAAALALAVWAASGNAARKHAPLPIGAAVAAALSIAACSVIVTHELWRTLFTGSTPTQVMAQLAATPRLRTIERLWPWFLALLPAVVVLVGTRFKRRASATAVANLAAFAPMVLVVSLAIDTETSSRRWFDDPYAGRNVDPLLPAEGIDLEDGFALPEVWTPTPAYNHADVVIDSSGAIMHGRVVATANELDGFRTTGGPPLLTRELAQIARARGVGDRIRIATRRDVPASALLGVLASTRTAGWTDVELLVSAGDAIHSVPIRPHDARMGAGGEITPYLRLGAYEYALTDAGTGAQVPIPRMEDALDDGVLRQALATAQSALPGRTTIRVNVDPSVPVLALVQGAAAAQSFFPTVLVADGAYAP